MYSVVEALWLAAQAGVEFVFNTTVEQIEVNGNAPGRDLADGQRLEADIVLANADLPYVYQDLLPTDGMAQSTWRASAIPARSSVSSGAWISPIHLGPHTLFLADDYRENFNSIIRDLGLPANPACISTPRRGSIPPWPRRTGYPDRDRAGRAPVSERQQDWAAIRDRARQQVFRRLADSGHHRPGRTHQI